MQDNKLIIYDFDAYIYNSENGEFLGIQKAEGLDLNYDRENEQPEELIDGEFCFDSHQVYKVDSDGTLHTVVSRPWWHCIFNFSVSISLSFICALGLGIILFIEKIISYCSVKKKVNFRDPEAKTIASYFKITSIIQLVYAVLDIFSGFLGGILFIGIMPIAIHFIISNCILWNKLDKISTSQEEKTVLDYWKAFEIVTFVIAFLSVIISAGLHG